MSAEVINNDLSPKSTWANKLRIRLWAIPVVCLILGAAAGYLYAGRNNDEQEARFNTQASLEKDRIYFNDKLDFSLVFPQQWVNNVITNNTADSSAQFFFKKPGDGKQKTTFQPVFTIYKCSSADFEALKGDTTDTNKCPGRFLDRDDTTTYTWQETKQKVDLISDLKSSDSVVDEFNRKISATFRIVK